MPKITAKDAIFEHLKSGKTLTPIEALRLFNCMRLAATIYDLREEGHDIVTHKVIKNNKTFAKYELRKKK